MHTVLRRVWNASPRSATAFAARLAGIRREPPPVVLRWERVRAGPLAGRELLLAREANGAWADMIEGRFDAELYEALADMRVRHPVMWDVGGHFGYHALAFAARDPASTVLCVEPNPANLERLRGNLARNPDLASRIEILPIAVGDREGELALVSSTDVDGGGSSCSHLPGSDTPFDVSAYASFISTSVPVLTIDALADGGRPAPALIKVDVEGGELMVLRGAVRALASYRPAWLIEVHTIGLMFQVQELLIAACYRLRLLSTHTASRAMIIALPDEG